MPARYLLFGTELYAVPILRPLARAARARGAVVDWLVPAPIAPYLPADMHRLTRFAETVQHRYDAVFSAANWVPPGIPGVKVQLFHGFNAEKRDPHRGHFRLRGFFDLYCTQGPATTQPFLELSRQDRYFAVEETGWPKLDPLFYGATSPVAERLREAAAGRPCVMYASTFTESLSSAPGMLDTLEQLVARGEWYWLLTLHPKCPHTLVQRYQRMAEAHPDHAVFMDSDHLLDMQRSADVLVCDTSSVIDEFAVQLKPVVTVKNRRPKPFMIDVQTPAEVESAVRRALRPTPQLQAALKAHADAIHPSRDGHASDRVLDAVARFQAGAYGPLARKPMNLWRRWQCYRDLRAMLAS
ncbi:CDP-glycerol glycerophosphotransferase family protein [Dyella sp. KULCS107]|uniref:CDP-glycerol glycerophosphotransferase family protein n=1 Tax=Dyella sp. KULCS107 TaxID=3422216 RepID=UPI003D700814